MCSLCPSFPALLQTAYAQSPPCHLYDATLETPCFDLLTNRSNYVIRTYPSSAIQGLDLAWSTATINSTSWSTAQQDGFQLNFAYISGENAAKQKIPMTGPVLCRQNSDSNWLVSFFAPTSLFPTVSQVPTPTNPDVDIETLQLSTIAVYEFGGYASENDFITAEATLRGFLAEDGVQVVSDSWGVAWAQYDSPFVIFNRHNEVWVHVQL